nr:hypothetical protein [Tanacetum cinerariifolium]
AVAAAFEKRRPDGKKPLITQRFCDRSAITAGLACPSVQPAFRTLLWSGRLQRSADHPGKRNGHPCDGGWKPSARCRPGRLCNRSGSGNAQPVAPAAQASGGRRYGCRRQRRS